MSTIRVAGCVGSVVIAAALFSACAVAKPPEAAHAPVARSVSRPAEHIYVTEDSLDTACYQKVGEVSYVESFAAAAVDPDHLGMADALRAAAAEKFPNQVDAIINVHADDHNIGTEVAVSGEAVRLEPPSKLDCKLPDKIAAAFVNFATNPRPYGARRGAAGAPAYNGPAGTSNSAQEDSGNEQGRQIKENIRRTIIATMPGQTQVNEQSLADEAQSQQLEIKDLRRQIDRIITQRCEAADISVAHCDSMRNAAELKQPHEVVAVASKDAGSKSPSVFEIQNLIQAQSELLVKLRHQLADMGEPPPKAAGASPSNR